MEKQSVNLTGSYFLNMLNWVYFFLFNSSIIKNLFNYFCLVQFDLVILILVKFGLNTRFIFKLFFEQ